jgi:hypothetical protein
MNLATKKENVEEACRRLTSFIDEKIKSFKKE